MTNIYEAHVFIGLLIHVKQIVDMAMFGMIDKYIWVQFF